MGTITTKDGVDIFFKDWGEGQPLVFHHGWPLSADDWDNQMMFFLAKGYRVVAQRPPRARALDRRSGAATTWTSTPPTPSRWSRRWA